MQSFVLGCSVLQVVLCAFILPTTPSFRQECPVVLKPDPPTARIMGGRPAADNLVPYLAYIQDPLSKVACTGTVISERHIVTAAHCMVSTSHTILVGIRDVSSLSDKNVAGKVKQFTAHPLWSRRKGAKYDVGVIELESAVSGRAMRVCISKSVPVAESFVRVVGYGATMFQGRREGLRQVDVPVVKTKSCDTAYGLAGADVDGEFEVCAGYLGRGGCDAWYV